MVADDGGCGGGVLGGGGGGGLGGGSAEGECTIAKLKAPTSLMLRAKKMPPDELTPTGSAAPPALTSVASTSVSIATPGS